MGSRSPYDWDKVGEWAMIKYMKLLSFTIISVYLVGCSEERPAINTGFPPSTQVSVTCVDGVLYYASPRALAPAFNRDGSIKTCQGWR